MSYSDGFYMLTREQQEAVRRARQEARQEYDKARETYISNPSPFTCQSPPTAPAKLHCPAHGKLHVDEAAFYINGTRYCPECVKQALLRNGVHQLVEKPPAVEKKW